MAKIDLPSLKIFLPRTTGPISTKFGTKCPWVKDTQGFYKERPFNFQKGGFSSPIQLYDVAIALLKCVYQFGLVFQVSVVAHGPRITFKTLCICLVKIFSLWIK